MNGLEKIVARMEADTRAVLVREIDTFDRPAQISMVAEPQTYREIGIDAYSVHHIHRHTVLAQKGIASHTGAETHLNFALIAGTLSRQIGKRDGHQKEKRKKQNLFHIDWD